MSVADGHRTAVAIIPARFDASRFPGKPLAPIAGIPMIERVVRRASRARLIREVYVATDDERIAAVAASCGARVVMTSASHVSGTDRVAEAAEQLDAELIVNVQGDQPLVAPDDLDALVRALVEPGGPAVATLSLPLSVDDDWTRPDVVKVVVGSNGDALYFSRSSIPYWRSGGGSRPQAALKHVGVYGFHRQALLDFAAMSPSSLEILEGLEQLRLVQNGVRMRIVPGTHDCPSVDRPEDVAVVEAILMREARSHGDQTTEPRTGE